MNRPVLLALIFSVMGSSLQAQDARQIVEEAQRRGRSQSEHYEGTLEVSGGGSKITTKRWIYDRLGSYGDSKSLLRFIAPAEVKGVALLVVNHTDRASDQWMWTPATERDRRIALQDRSARFFGTDFSFEDLEERDVNQFDAKLLGDDTLAGTSCWKIELTPKATKSSQYTSIMLWVRKDNYVSVQSEAYRKQELVRRIQYSDLEKIKNVWTPKRTEVFDLGRKSHTILQLDKLEYDRPMKDEDFTLQALRRAS